MSRTFYFAVATTIRNRLVNEDCDDESRDKIARFARKAADHLKRGDPAFNYDWFFGACGLDNWGESLPPVPALQRRVKWDPAIGDFRIVD